MAYEIRLPSRPDGRPAPATLDIVDGVSTVLQRALRREGLAGYEPPTMAGLLALLDLQPPGFTFFDVGANMGLYAELAAVLFAPANVVAFEPTPRTARSARAVAKRNRTGVTVEELALGAADGEAKLYLSAKSDASNSLVSGFKKARGTITVDVCTLDTYVARTGFVPTVMKVDTETFEPQVLSGGMETLRRHRPAMVIEVLHRRGHDHGEDLMGVIDGLGYHYYRLGTDRLAPEPTITGDPDSPSHDWLLMPEPLDDDFATRIERWRQAVADCTPDRHQVTFTGRWPGYREAAANRVRDRVAEGRDLIGKARRRGRRAFNGWRQARYR